jgi:hypothetical protein
MARVVIDMNSADFTEAFDYDDYDEVYTFLTHLDAHIGDSVFTQSVRDLFIKLCEEDEELVKRELE